MSSAPFAAPGLHGTAIRVEYHSQSVAGDDIVVSGLVAYPDQAVAAPPTGRPVLTFAHGTTGIGDSCAPSTDPGSLAALTLVANRFLDQGMVVVETDYEGLGEPGRHPYLVGPSEGRGVLDIVRAAQHVGDAHAGNDVVIWGHSQGGHAALFATEIAPQWAPELHILGTIAGAPATEMPLIVTGLASAANPFYLVMIAVGFQAAYPELDLHDVLTDEAISRIGVVDTGCSAAIKKAYANLPGGGTVKTDPEKVPAWKARLDASDPGHVRTDDPIFIYQGGSDEVIPVALSGLLFSRLCGLGQVAQRTIYPGQSHAGALVAGLGDITAWIDARVAGQAAVNGCPSP